MDQQLPEPSFQIIISTFATQAAVALGQIANPVTNETSEDLEQAKFAIDVLTILEEKTKGNLTDEEERFIRDLLFELRMKFVETSKEAGGG